LSRQAPIAVLLCLVLGATGCGGDGDDSSSSVSATAQPAAAEGSPPARPPGPIETQSGAQAAKRPEPTVSPPAGPPPRKLLVEDLIKGSGPVAAPGDELAVHFVAIRYGGEFFESIWDKPFTFYLGVAYVNPGWVRGLPGMRVGGRRELVVPPQLTSRYGVSPYDSDPQKALVYVVDLLRRDSR
jgi:FKBP-type peptidyl-prolyl cis-trans isomerase